MKKAIRTSLWILVLGIFAMTLSGCGSKESKAVKTIETSQEQMMEISEKMMNGDISVEEWEKILEDIAKDMGTQEDTLKDAYTNISDFDGLPKRAKNIWLYELKWFDLIKEESVIIEFSKKNYTPESLTLVYKYSDEAKAIQEMEKMAGSIWFEESSMSPRLLQKQTDEMVKSMFEFMSEEDKIEYEKNKISGYVADWEIGDYYLMLSVIDDKIMILANNNAQMVEIME